MRFLLLIFLWVVSGIVSCGGDSVHHPIPETTGSAKFNEIHTPRSGPYIVPRYTYTVTRSYPHDREAFTQGLVYESGGLYEGTGRFGRSSLRKVELTSGRVLQVRDVGKTFFGEGITILGKRVIQLTWKSNIGFIYEKDTFKRLGSFTYPGEGWGLTNDGERLIMSDGTATIRFLDPETFEESGRIQVSCPAGPVKHLNELEYVQGQIYANVLYTDLIARIDPGTGRVVGWIDLAGLLTPEDRRFPVNVLNGIAYDPEGNRLFVTGKLWPRIYEIELVPVN